MYNYTTHEIHVHVRHVSLVTIRHIAMNVINSTFFHASVLQLICAFQGRSKRGGGGGGGGGYINPT